MRKNQTAQSTAPNLGEQIAALGASIESRTVQLEHLQAEVANLQVEHSRGMSKALHVGSIYTGSAEVPTALSSKRAELDTMLSTQRIAQKHLTDLQSQLDADSDLSDVEGELSMLAADAARIKASAAQVRAKSAEITRALQSAIDALGAALDSEAIAALEGDDTASSAAAGQVVGAQALVDRHTRASGLAAQRLVQIAENGDAVQAAIAARSHRLASAQLHKARRRLGELLPEVLSVCAEAYAAGYRTGCGTLGAAAEVPDLLRLTLDAQRAQQQALAVD